MAQASALKDTVVNNLIRYRKMNNLTGEEVARAIGINHGTYRNYENGRAFPKLECLMSLAKIYNVNIDSLINIENDETCLELHQENIYGDAYLSELSDIEKIFLMKFRILNNKDKISLLNEMDKLLEGIE